MFETAAPIYREALTKSGYDYELKFDPTASEPSTKNRNRTRNRVWFNPPYSAAVRSNIGRDFLSLVTKCFPPGHPLRKIFNRNTVKVGYSCTPNIESIISSRNKKLLAAQKTDERECSCPKNTPCPLGGQCLRKNLVYQATVTQEDGTQNHYTGLCSTSFKARLGAHKQAFKTVGLNPTSLSKFIWKLKHRDKNPKVTWKILDRGDEFSPLSNKCSLCYKEKFYILFHPESADINSRDEIFSTCCHRKTKLLIPIERGRKKIGETLAKHWEKLLKHW